MSLAKLASGARKHQHCRPVLLDTLWQQYLPRQSLLCTSSYTNKQQLRNFGFGSHMNDNDPVPFLPSIVTLFITAGARLSLSSLYNLTC